MTREEYDDLSAKYNTATDLFKQQANLESIIASVTKCYLTVHNGDNVQAPGIRVKAQEEVRTIVILQLNNELTDVMKKILEL